MINRIQQLQQMQQKLQIYNQVNSNHLFILEMKTCPSNRKQSESQDKKNIKFPQNNNNLVTPVKKPKSIHIYSALTAETDSLQNKLNFLSQKKEKTQRIKIQTPITTLKKQIQPQQKNKEQKSNSTLKFRLCSQNLCQIQLQNPCKIQDLENQNEQNRFKNQRIVYSSKKQSKQSNKRINSTNSNGKNIKNVGQSVFSSVNNSPSHKKSTKIGLQTGKLGITVSKQISSNQQKYVSNKQTNNCKYQSPKLNFYYTNYRQAQNNCKQPYRNNSTVHQQYMNKHLLNRLQQFKNPTKTTDNSFSIINLSSLQNSSQNVHNYNHQQHNQNINYCNDKKNINKIQKLKQIYLNTHQSSDSFLQEQFLANNYFQDNSNKRNDQLINLKNSQLINFKNYDDTKFNQQVNLLKKINDQKAQQSHTRELQKLSRSVVNSGRTIIDLLQNLQQGEQKDFKKNYSQKKTIFIKQVNPQNSFYQNNSVYQTSSVYKMGDFNKY